MVAKRKRSTVATLAATKVLTAAASLTPAPKASQLYSLGASPGALVRATFLRRPSARNKSPYVGDILLPDGREAIAHMPAMDMGGKAFEGVEVLLQTSIDAKTKEPVAADAMGKFNTPRCQFKLQLLKCSEPENAHLGGDGCWVGAHPSIGEKVAHELLSRGRLDEELGCKTPIVKIEREVRNVAGCDMRTDFLLTHEDGSKTVVEVKTVVDTDYDPQTAPSRKGCVFVGQGDPYVRSAIFPWGKSGQTGPDGEKVVSARAIKHVRELTSLAKGEKVDLDDGARLNAAVLFVVVRRDAMQFRANAEACPSFARYLSEAHQAGVKVIARRVRWGEADGEDLGVAIDDGSLPVSGL